MHFARNKNYKLTEFKNGLIITDQNQTLREPTAQPLLIADAGPLLTYLDRYFYERERGNNLKISHDRALATAQIPAILKCIGRPMCMCDVIPPHNNLRVNPDCPVHGEKRSGG